MYPHSDRHSKHTHPCTRIHHRSCSRMIIYPHTPDHKHDELLLCPEGLYLWTRCVSRCSIRRCIPPEHFCLRPGLYNQEGACPGHIGSQRHILLCCHPRCSQFARSSCLHCHTEFLNTIPLVIRLHKYSLNGCSSRSRRKPWRCNKPRIFRCCWDNAPHSSGRSRFGPIPGLSHMR